VARSSQSFGSDQNTLPLELTGLTTTVTNPEIYALGTVTTGVSFAVIVTSLTLIRALRRRPAAPGRAGGS
jgi:putative spermidine/putrescine transport system permease protein